LFFLKKKFKFGFWKIWEKKKFWCKSLDPSQSPQIKILGKKLIFPPLKETNLRKLGLPVEPNKGIKIGNFNFVGCQVPLIKGLFGEIIPIS